MNIKIHQIFSTFKMEEKRGIVLGIYLRVLKIFILSGKCAFKVLFKVPLLVAKSFSLLFVRH